MNIKSKLPVTFEQSINGCFIVDAQGKKAINIDKRNDLLVNAKIGNSIVRVVNGEKTMKESEHEFIEQVGISNNDILNKNELMDFISYWTEKNPNGRKMRFEKEKTFDSQKVSTLEKEH
jgi:hypothetical protein